MLFPVRPNSSWNLCFIHFSFERLKESCLEFINLRMHFIILLFYFKDQDSILLSPLCFIGKWGGEGEKGRRDRESGGERFLLLAFLLKFLWGFPGDSVIKNSPSSVGDMGSIPGSGRSPRGGHGNPLQHSCLENPIIKGALLTCP